MGKMTYKRRKNVKKQSFKKRKNKKMKGGDATVADVPDPAATETSAVPSEGDTDVDSIADKTTPPGTDADSIADKTTTPGTDANAEGDSTPPGTDVNAEGNTTDPATTETHTPDDNTPAVEGAPESDDGYVQFLKELKENPGGILRKKVYVWHDVSEIYIYNTAANKWENKIDDVTEDANTTTASAATANTTTEGAAKTDAPPAANKTTDAAVVHEGDANTADDATTVTPAPETPTS